MPKVTISRLPRLFGAEALALTAERILLHPDRATDVPLIEHESVHCRQIREEGGALAFWWRYITDREFRLECELEGYRVQLQLQPEGLFHLRLDQYARRLATSYRLGISADSARALLLAS